MAIRFRRSVRLFPGVRLNFSGSGISTTVGVRGASMTLGRHGTHVNLGVPGSGLSYRSRVDPGSKARAPAGGIPDDNPALPEISPTQKVLSGAVAITSTDVNGLTSPGLGELKRLINEAIAERTALQSQLAIRQVEMGRAVRRLDFARWFIVRIFTREKIPFLLEAARVAHEALDETKAALEGCYVPVDFGLDEHALRAFDKLANAFEQLSSCARIWDLTQVTATDRVAQRTVASQSLSRVPVRFDLTSPEIIRSSQRVLHLGEASGRDIYFYPAFVMMREPSGAFALMEYRDIDAVGDVSYFIEEEAVPEDARVTGQTWAKANKDGSPDRRFKDNYAIPVVSYGRLSLRSAAGLFEAYMFSDLAKAEMFFAALDDHRQALVNLLRRGGGPAPEVDTEDSEGEADEAKPEPIFADIKDLRESFLMDWVALVVVTLLVVSGGFWGVLHRAELVRAAKIYFAPAVAAAAAPVPTVTASPPAPLAKSAPHKKVQSSRHGRRRKRASVKAH